MVEDRRKTTNLHQRSSPATKSRRRQHSHQLPCLNHPIARQSVLGTRTNWLPSSCPAHSDEPNAAPRHRAQGEPAILAPSERIGPPHPRRRSSPDARYPATVKFGLPRRRLRSSSDEFGTSKLPGSRYGLPCYRIVNNDSDSDDSWESTSTVRREYQRVSNRAHLDDGRSSSTAARMTFQVLDHRGARGQPRIRGAYRQSCGYIVGEKGRARPLGARRAGEGLQGSLSGPDMG